MGYGNKIRTEVYFSRSEKSSHLDPGYWVIGYRSWVMGFSINTLDFGLRTVFGRD